MDTLFPSYRPLPKKTLAFLRLSGGMHNKKKDLTISQDMGLLFCMFFLKDKVIVLKQNKFGESDLIIRTLNTQGALISFIAKGALKSKKRFSGGMLEPTSFIGVEYKKPRPIFFSSFFVP